MPPLRWGRWQVRWRSPLGGSLLVLGVAGVTVGLWLVLVGCILVGA